MNVGDKVLTAVKPQVPVRAVPDTSAPAIGTQPIYTQGTITGALTNNFYQVAFPTQPSGWVWEPNLILVVAPTGPTAPTAPTAPTGPVPTNLIPAVGSNRVSMAHNRGPADWIDLAKLPLPAIPYTNYYDSDHRIAPSCNGVRPTALRVIPLFGNENNLYSCVPMLRNGRHMQWNPQPYSGDDFSSIVPRTKSNPAPVGLRGVCAVEPYVTWRGHPTIPGNPRTPLFVGLRADNMFIYAMAYPAGIVEAGAVPGLNGPHDFTFFPPKRQWLYLTDTGNKRVVKIDRTAAILAQTPPALEDSTLWVVATHATGFIKPVGIRSIDDGTTFVCDEGAGILYRVDANGNKTVEQMIPGVFWCDYFSDQTLVLVTNQMHVYRYDPVHAALGPNLMPLQYISQAAWCTVSVDRAGTFGPKDDWCVIRSTGGGGNVNFWDFRNGGATVLYNTQVFPNASISTVGDLWHCAEPQGHYVWSGEHHPDQGVRLTQGFANSFPGIVRARIPSDAVEEPHDHALYRLGRAIIRAGTTAAYQKLTGNNYIRPSFTALITDVGHGLLGITADYIAALPFAQAEAFIRSGMGGSVPRPEIDGYDMKAVLYWALKSSQRYLTEGASLISAMFAYIAAKYPNAAPTQEPIWGSAFSTDTHLRGRYAAGKITVTGEDMYGNVKTIGSGVIVDVIVDQGRPTEWAQTVGWPWQVTLPALTSGPHAITCYSTTYGYYSIGNVIEA